MLKKKLTGLGVALITPFKENEMVDYDALERLLTFHLQSATDYLVVLGTTAETPTLTETEKDEVTRFVVEKVQGRLPIVLGFGGNNTRAMLEKLQTADFSGIDALLISTPYYNKPSQEGLYRHYKALAAASPLPIILYNVPSRTGVNMTAETTLRLAAEFPNIVAIKEASGKVEQAEEVIRNAPTHFSLISGDDALAFPLIKRGAIGVISVLGNAFPQEFGQMARQVLSGNSETACETHLQFAELIDLLFVEGSPAGVKSVLFVMGLAENKLRLPLTSVSAATFDKICQALKKLEF